MPLDTRVAVEKRSLYRREGLKEVGYAMDIGANEIPVHEDQIRAPVLDAGEVVGRDRAE
jgi:hypothetical protein